MFSKSRSYFIFVNHTVSYPNPKIILKIVSYALKLGYKYYLICFYHLTVRIDSNKDTDKGLVSTVGIS